MVVSYFGTKLGKNEKIFMHLKRRRIFEYSRKYRKHTGSQFCFFENAAGSLLSVCQNIPVPSADLLLNCVNMFRLVVTIPK